MKWNGMEWNARTEAECGTEAECANGSGMRERKRNARSGNEMREAGAEAEYNNSIL